MCAMTRDEATSTVVHVRNDTTFLGDGAIAAKQMLMEHFHGRGRSMPALMQ